VLIEYFGVKAESLIISISWRLTFFRTFQLTKYKPLMSASHRAYGLYGQARMVNAYGHPKTGDPRLFLLSWHRRDVDPSNAEDDMKPPRSSPAFISRSN